MRTWTPEELELLRMYYSEGRELSWIRDALGRSISSIKSKASRLGLTHGQSDEARRTENLEVLEDLAQMLQSSDPPQPQTAFGQRLVDSLSRSLAQAPTCDVHPDQRLPGPHAICPACAAEDLQDPEEEPLQDAQEGPSEPVPHGKTEDPRPAPEARERLLAAPDEDERAPPRVHPVDLDLDPAPFRPRGASKAPACLACGKPCPPPRVFYGGNRGPYHPGECAEAGKERPLEEGTP